MKVLDYKVEGLNEVLAQFAEAAQHAPRLVSQAVYEEGEALMTSVKADPDFPVDTGALKSSGRVKQPEIRGTFIDVELGFGGAAAPYALYVHEGTDPYIITPRKKKVLAVPVGDWDGPVNPYNARELPKLSRDGAYVILGRRVKHPGIEGQKYLERPALKWFEHIDERLAAKVRQLMEGLG